MPLKNTQRLMAPPGLVSQSGPSYETAPYLGYGQLSKSPHSYLQFLGRDLPPVHDVIGQDVLEDFGDLDIGFVNCVEVRVQMSKYLFF